MSQTKVIIYGVLIVDGVWSRFYTQVFFYIKPMSIRQNEQLGGRLSENRFGTGVGWWVRREMFIRHSGVDGQDSQVRSQDPMCEFRA